MRAAHAIAWPGRGLTLQQSMSMHDPNEQPNAERPAGPESSSADDEPQTQPEGSLVPPPGKPPTAVGAADESPFNPRRFVEAWRQPGWRGKSRIENVATEILDALDQVADRIAERLGLRH